MTTPADEVFMAQALKLAQKGIYTTDPNPRVGCVIVRDHQVIAEGWHQFSGHKHAEIMALEQVDDVTGATVYVSLEPCCHTGKTPPCSQALIRAGVSRVVIAMTDPNPEVSGRGVAELEAAGIKTDTLVLAEEAKRLNRGFITRMQRQKPFVIAKLAASLDGRTAMASGESQWITSAQSRVDVHRLRASSSAVVTGITTVIADDPLLTARLGDVEVTQPVRVVLDSTLKTPITAAILTGCSETWIMTVSDDGHRKAQLEALGAKVFTLPETEQGRVDLNAVLSLLAARQINQLMLEAGPTLNGAFLEQDLVDEWCVYLAPSILGDAGRGLFHLPSLHAMADKVTLSLQTIRQVGPDIKLTYTK
ncbi:MAG: bifunctional diaminohydroxyphosphoribosylaminopyrimidine deaminase/5-amino-6-(5-phosphoribosylamino)uracil reductase RibD [Methylococcales bacterium]|jgi:diaminohydroxyphosphoribosylaminopyrimidine deaminase/5-amino-6-(5-phosphoribosylamino)uracil reductase|nr:bifunctional diaminohydroxyphosphoribosylaminopyrimidine deaminase/5-amino-6-(5-phosphoribosylamino)uracil reductase RibD [Methylococcaceae bacterium]HIL41321.1 bifunctional diaminohydroxyphosphoribosylaminopyrimidine deaminase/5-amino-6-(5-phosphoribosylamino)uracil reductase RibD [Methylococcales bacterium]